MQQIAIISSSVRIGRKSHRVAIYFQRFITEKNLGVVDMIDLNEFDFPLFNERLKFTDNPTPKVLDFRDRIIAADGIIIVTPEYNGGYPPGLKNVIDLLYEEWHHKPIAIATVSRGKFGGMQCIVSLQFTLWKMKAFVVPAMYPVSKINDRFDENGIPSNPEKQDELTERFIHELHWMINAVRKMKSGDQ